MERERAGFLETGPHLLQPPQAPHHQPRPDDQDHREGDL